MALNKVTMIVEKTNGRYTVNGKSLSEMNQIEQKFLNDFFQEVRQKESLILNK